MRLRWAQEFKEEMPTQSRTWLEGQQQVPDLEPLRAQIVEWEGKVDEFVEVVGDDYAAIQILSLYRLRYKDKMDVVRELRGRLKTAEKLEQRITEAADGMLEQMRATTTPAIHHIIRKHARAPNRLEQARRAFAEIREIWGGDPMEIFQAILREVQAIQLARTRDEILQVLAKLKRLLQEYDTLRQEFPAVELPELMADVAIAPFLRARMADDSAELALMRTAYDQPRIKPTRQQFEADIIFYAQQGRQAGGEQQQQLTQQQQQQQQQQQPQHPAAHLAAMAAGLTGQWEQPFQAYQMQQVYPVNFQQPAQTGGQGEFSANAAIPNPTGTGAAGAAGGAGGMVGGLPQLPPPQGWGGGGPGQRGLFQPPPYYQQQMHPPPVLGTGYGPPRPWAPLPASDERQCRFFQQTGNCPYGERCVFKHGDQDPRRGGGR